MAVFTGYEFMYDNILSSRFDLTIGYIKSTSGSENILSTSTEIVTQKLNRRSKVYSLGVVSNEQLTFNISFFREYPISPDERDTIANWLTNKSTFKRLQIIQDDMNSIYYNCYFSDLKYVVFSAQAYGFTATAICDAPFAWKNMQQSKKENITGIDGNYPEITLMDIYNISSDTNLTRPKSIIIELGENSNSFKLTNISNDNEYFQFTNLSNGEKIFIDCDLEIIESLTNPNKIIIDNFTGEFLKLINGINKLKIEGQIKSISLSYQSGRKVG